MEHSLAIGLSAQVVEALDLKEGDKIDIRVVEERAFDLALDRDCERALERINGFRKQLLLGHDSTTRRQTSGSRCDGRTDRNEHPVLRLHPGPVQRDGRKSIDQGLQRQRPSAQRASQCRAAQG